MDSAKNLPVAVIGAGPVGLAAAAHLIERGLRTADPRSRAPGGRRHRASGATSAVLPVGVRHRRRRRPPAGQRPDGQAPRADGRCPTGGNWSTKYLAPLAATSRRWRPAPHRRPGRRGDPARHGQDPHRRPRQHALRGPDRHADGGPRYDRRRGHRRLRQLVHPQPARHLRAACYRRRPPPRPDFRAAAGRRWAGTVERSPAAGCLVVGAGHSAANTLIALVRSARGGTGDRDRLGDPRRIRPRRSTAAATPTGCPPAASSAPASQAASAGTVRTAHRLRASPPRRGRRRLAGDRDPRTAGPSRSTSWCVHRLPPGPGHPAGSPAGPGPGGRGTRASSAR